VHDERAVLGLERGSSVIVPACAPLASTMPSPFGSGPSWTSIVSPDVGSTHVLLIKIVPSRHAIGSIEQRPVNGS
jgi:hypothetical protein